MSDEVDLDEIASLVGTVSQSLHQRLNPTINQTTKNGDKKRGPSSLATRRDHEAEPDTAKPSSQRSSRRGSSPPPISQHSQSRSLSSRANTMEFDESPISHHSSLSESTLASIPSSQTSSGSRVRSRSHSSATIDPVLKATPKPIVRQNSIPLSSASSRPSPLRRQLSPAMEKPTRLPQSSVMGRNRSLGMKGHQTSLAAAAKPFKAPLPKPRAAAPSPTVSYCSNGGHGASQGQRSAQTRAPPAKLQPQPSRPPEDDDEDENDNGGAGDLSSDSLADLSFGVDMDVLEEQLKVYDG